VSNSLTDELIAWAQNFTGLNICTGGQTAGANGAQSAPAPDADATNVNAIQSQMAADAMQQQMQRWKVLQDTQTKIFEIQQDVTANKSQTQDKAYQKWDEYIRG
jgi:hypothetical protein